MVQNDAKIFFKLIFIAIIFLMIFQTSFGQGTIDSKKTADKSTKFVDEQNSKDKILKNMQGVWIHTEDKLSTIDITGFKWIFKYKDSEITDDSRYNIQIDFKLPQFVDTIEKADFLILTNNSDTLYYEILGFTNKTMSLMHYPSTKKHLYKRK